MHIKKRFNTGFKNWLPLAISIIMLSALIFVGVQHNYRQSANDPQIQIAEDIVAAIGQGQPADAIVSPEPTADMAKGLSPFLIVYNESGSALGGSVQLDGKIPVLPAGVFNEAKKNGQHRLTWKPKDDVSMATVVMYYGGEKPGFIAVGRSLREVEKRISQMTITIALGTAATLLATLLLSMLLVKPEPQHHEAHLAEHGHEHHHT